MPILIVIAIIIIIKKTTRKMKILNIQKIRISDNWGSGLFGAKRGNRKHKGVDLIVNKYDEVKAPFDGKVRVGRPYSTDYKYKLIEISNGKEKVKIMYVNPVVNNGDYVKKGQIIAQAQDISEKYSPTMTPHIHVEYYKNNILKNPTKYLT